MSDVLKLFGYLSLLGGVIVAAVLVLVPLSDGATVTLGMGLVAVAWLLGGAFWAALCVTVATTHDAVVELRRQMGPGA